MALNTLRTVRKKDVDMSTHTPFHLVMSRKLVVDVTLQYRNGTGEEIFFIVVARMVAGKRLHSLVFAMATSTRKLS
jgi:hypothetical protein